MVVQSKKTVRECDKEKSYLEHQARFMPKCLHRGFDKVSDPLKHLGDAEYREATLLRRGLDTLKD